MAAVQENGDALRYVKEEAQTEAVCLAAVERNGDALQYVKESLITQMSTAAAATARDAVIDALAEFVKCCQGAQAAVDEILTDPAAAAEQSRQADRVARGLGAISNETNGGA